MGLIYEWLNRCASTLSPEAGKIWVFPSELGQPLLVMPRLMFVRCILLFVTLAGSCFGAGPVMETTFLPQLPVSPGLYDSPTTSTRGCSITLEQITVRWQAPSAGVTSNTGLIVVCPGANPVNDCIKPTQYGDPTWPDSKNVVMCTVFYRNQAFSYPYDFGKLQMSDTLRGIGLLLNLYPQLDRRRLYLFGASSGGHVSLQLLQCARHLWAEVHVHCPPTRITTYAEAIDRYHNDGLGDGLNDNGLHFPEEQGSLSAADWQRFQAERDLRGPQNNMRLDMPVSGTGDWPKVWAMFATLDEIVDLQHYRDLLAVVQSGTNSSGAKFNVLAGERWQVREWNLYTVVDGHHDFSGANSNVNSYSKATNYRVPDAFTRVRPTVPTLTVDYVFPVQHGWRFHVQGQLTSATVVTEGPIAEADGSWREIE